MGRWAISGMHACARKRTHDMTFWWEKKRAKTCPLRSVSQIKKQVQVDFYPSPSVTVYVSKKKVFLPSETVNSNVHVLFLSSSPLFLLSSRCLSVTWFKAVSSVRSWRLFRRWSTTVTSSAPRRVSFLLVFVRFLKLFVMVSFLCRAEHAGDGL